MDEDLAAAVEWAVDMVDDWLTTNAEARAIQATFSPAELAVVERQPARTVSTLAPAMAMRLPPATLAAADAFLTSTKTVMRQVLDGSVSYPLRTMAPSTKAGTGSDEVSGGNDDRQDRLERLEAQVAELLTLLRHHVAECPSSAEVERSLPPAPRRG